MTTSTTTPAPGRDVLFGLGMAAVSLAAAISSYSGLASLADLAGWNHKLALLLPVTIDAYAMTATRVWLSARTPQHARRWARRNAIGAILTSVAGNGIAHAARAGEFHVGWPIVVAVSAIPSIVLGLITHLWHLRNTPDPTPTAPAPETRPQPSPVAPAALPAASTGGPVAAPSNSPAAGSTGGPVPAHRRTPTGGAKRGTTRAATGGKQAERTDAELLDSGRLMAATAGAAPSASRMVRELHIGTGRAKRLAAVLAAEPIPSDAAAVADHQAAAVPDTAGSAA